MADFNSNQFIQRRVNVRICDVSQGFVERQVEQLIEDECSSRAADQTAKDDLPEKVVMRAHAPCRAIERTVSRAVSS